MTILNWKKFFAVAVCITTLAACSESSNHEERITASMNEMEIAVQERDVRAFMDKIHTNYSDSDGRSWKEIRGLTQLQILRNKNLHIFKVVKNVNVQETTADVMVFVAVAGQPIADASSLAGLNAELLRFDLTWELQDDEWQVISADWRRIQAQDFLL